MSPEKLQELEAEVFDLCQKQDELDAEHELVMSVGDMDFALEHYKKALKIETRHRTIDCWINAHYTDKLKRQVCELDDLLITKAGEIDSDKSFDKSTTGWQDDTRVMSLDEFNKCDGSVTRDGVPYKSGMIIWDGNMMPMRIAWFETHDSDLNRHPVVDGQHTVLYCYPIDRFGLESPSYAKMQPEKLYANYRNALIMGGWKRD